MTGSRVISGEMPSTSSSLTMKWINDKFVPIAQIAFLVGFIYALVQIQYFGVDYVARIGWIARDAGYPEMFAFGNHFFSDYSGVLQWSQMDNPWEVRNNIYPAFPIAITKFLSYIPYKLSLFLWITFSVFSICLPLFHATKKFSLNLRVQIIVLLGISTAPAISILDRGNNLGFTVSLLYFSYVFWERKSFVIAGILFGLFIAMKIYPLLLIPFFLVRKSFRLTVVAIGTATLANAISFAIWGNLFRNISMWFENMFIWGDRGFVTDPTFVSGSTIFGNLFAWLLSFFRLKSDFVSNYPIVFSIVFYAISLFLMLNLKNRKAFIYGISTLQFVPLVSFSYTRFWTIVAFAIVFLSINDMSESRSKTSKSEQLDWTDVLLITSLFLISSNIVIYTPFYNGLLLTIGSVTFLFVMVAECARLIKERKSLEFSTPN